MKVVGLDLSLTATGLAGPDATLLQTIAAPGLRGTERLVALRDEIMFAINLADGADLIVLEDLPVGARNTAAGPLGMLHGVIRVALHEAHLPTVLIPPASLKKYACGVGNATKADLRVELVKRAGLDVRDDNQVDAWWLRAMGLDQYGEPPLRLPKEYRVALDKIEWPEVGALREAAA